MWWYDPSASPGWHDWVGLALTVIGFWVAIVQLRKTRTATEAAARELSRAKERLNTDQLAAAVAQLQLIVADIDFSIDNNDREVAHRALLRFSYVAKESVAMLQNLPACHADLEERLGLAAENALDAKGAIVGKKDVDVARVAKAIGKNIRALSVEITGLVARDRYQLRVSDNV